MPIAAPAPPIQKRVTTPTANATNAGTGPPNSTASVRTVPRISARTPGENTIEVLSVTHMAIPKSTAM